MFPSFIWFRFVIKKDEKMKSFLPPIRIQYETWHILKTKYLILVFTVTGFAFQIQMLTIFCRVKFIP